MTTIQQAKLFNALLPVLIVLAIMTIIVLEGR